MLLTAQIDGSILIVNYASQSIILQVQLLGCNIPPPLSDDHPPINGNCLFFMRPYSDFHIEHNPVLLVND